MSQPAQVEFFYDCSSPWTYFAFTRIIPMAQRLNATIDWRPILVGGVFNAVNKDLYAHRAAAFAEPDSPRMRYYFKDLQDWARLCGVKAVMPPNHPVSSVKAMRGACYAAEMDCLLPYSRAVFATYWGGENSDIASDAVLAGICAEVGLEAEAFFTAINDSRYKDQLRANTDEVIARGGFGSPTIFVGGEDMYFGNDRLELVEAALIASGAVS
jgi:2-hydroxychromene-2-carboxylate isomerase